MEVHLYGLKFTHHMHRSTFCLLPQEILVTCTFQVTNSSAIIMWHDIFSWNLTKIKFAQFRRAHTTYYGLCRKDIKLLRNYTWTWEHFVLKKFDNTVPYPSPHSRPVLWSRSPTTPTQTNHRLHTGQFVEVMLVKCISECERKPGRPQEWAAWNKIHEDRQAEGVVENVIISLANWEARFPTDGIHGSLSPPTCLSHLLTLRLTERVKLDKVYSWANV